MPRLPSDELTEYLQRRSVAPADAQEVMALYAQAVANGGAATWDRDRTYEWLDEQIGALDATQAAGGGSEDSSSVENTQGAAARVSASAEAAADEVNEAAARARLRYKVADEYVTDYGPAVDPSQISTSLAVGAWVDDKGNYVDPITGQPTEEPIPANADTVWQMIRGQRFNMGALTMPGPEERRRAGYRPRRGFTGTEPGTESDAVGGAKLLAKLGIMPPPGSSIKLGRPENMKFLTPSQAMALLGSMDETYLTSLQQSMWDAGLYSTVGEGVRPDWGKADPNTQAAFRQLFIEASLDPRMPIQQVLADLANRNILNLGDVPGAPGSSTGQAPDFAPEVTSTETLSSLIDEMGTSLLGQHVDDATKKTIIERLQAKETDSQRTAYDQQLNRYNRGGDSGMPGMEDIDAFMSAISGRESGGDYGAVNEGSGASGKYQIMPANWRPWATRAGLGPDAPRTPENQEIVAKRIMMDYYAQFGNWRDVAVAWFAGPGAVGAPGAGNRSDGNMTVNQYADDVLNRMAGLRDGSGADAGGGQSYAPTERFDVSAEATAALKAADPNGWVGHQWGERAVEFYNLLGGVA